jgi:hypothetical protein
VTGVVVLAGALVLSLLLNATIGILYQDQRAQNRTLEDRIANLEREQGSGTRAGARNAIAEIAADVERLRGLRFKREVKPELLSAAALQRRVGNLFDEDNSRPDFENTQRVLEVIGVIEEDLPLWERFVDAHEEQVGGFYDEQAQELVVLAEDGENISPFSRILLAHELTHALTDQHFGLAKGTRLARRGEEDASAAFLALTEGDATLLMTRYAQEVLTADELAAAQIEQLELSTSALDRLPVFLQRSLQFPYVEGLAFAQALYERGGNEAIDRAYRDPPASTEQILHPQQYIDGAEAPVAPALDGVGDALGAAWRRIDRGEVGEIDLRLLGDIQTASGGLTEQESRLAAEGWAGGRYVAYARGAQTVVAMRIAYDSDTEATEAAESYADWLPLRYGNVGSPFDAGGDGRGWRGRSGAGMVVRSGDEIAIILGPKVRTVRDARAGLTGF